VVLSSKSAVIDNPAARTGNSVFAGGAMLANAAALDGKVFYRYEHWSVRKSTTKLPIFSICPRRGTWARKHPKNTRCNAALTLKNRQIPIFR